MCKAQIPFQDAVAKLSTALRRVSGCFDTRLREQHIYALVRSIDVKFPIARVSDIHKWLDGCLRSFRAGSFYLVYSVRRTAYKFRLFTFLLRCLVSVCASDAILLRVRTSHKVGISPHGWMCTCMVKYMDMIVFCCCCCCVCLFIHWHLRLCSFVLTNHIDTFSLQILCATFCCSIPCGQVRVWCKVQG